MGKVVVVVVVGGEKKEEKDYLLLLPLPSIIMSIGSLYVYSIAYLSYDDDAIYESAPHVKSRILFFFVGPPAWKTKEKGQHYREAVYLRWWYTA